MVGEISFPAANPAVQGLPMNACGSCWEMQCTSSVAGKVTTVWLTKVPHTARLQHAV